MLQSRLQVDHQEPLEGGDRQPLPVAQEAAGPDVRPVREQDLPVVQPICQKRIWDRFKPGDGAARLAQVIEQLKKEDHRFHMEGGSWTNNISWVRGYDSLLGPMEKGSSLFYEKILKPGMPTSDPRYRNALFHLLCSQTSCYRYWGQGIWTDYGREICRRLEAILTHDV